jgi:hypothetical protein
VSDGRRIVDLSLAECRVYDPQPHRSRGRLRFRCPRHGGDHQKSLELDELTGKFRCYNAGCMIWGTAVERRRDRQAASDWGKPARGGWRRPTPAPLPPLRVAAPLPPNTYAVERAGSSWRQFPGSPAQEYARRRGVPDEIAARLCLGYWRGVWQKEDSEWLTFPLRCPVTGRRISVYGRNLHSDDQDRKCRLLGPRGLFGAPTPGPIPEEVVLVEGPFEVLALLASPGLLPARAVIGASARADWFDHCRQIILLFDDDTAGRVAADRLVDEINARRRRKGSGPRVLCLRPDSLRTQYGCKDLGELLARGVPVRLSLPQPAPAALAPTV